MTVSTNSIAAKTVSTTKNIHEAYEPESKNRRFTYVFDLIYELVIRDIKLRYKGSILGIGWSLLHPLILLFVYRFVFSNIFLVQSDNYTTYLFTGLLSFTWFNTSLVASTNSIVVNRNLIRRPGFPSATLPLISVISQLIHFVIATPILFAIIIYDGGSLSSYNFYLPLVIAVQALFTLSLTYWFSTLHVVFRDTKYLLELFFRLLFFLSPIIYTLDQIPERFIPFFKLNPLTHLIESYQNILIGHVPPSFLPLIVLTIISLILLFAGYTMFKKAALYIVEEL